MNRKDLPIQRRLTLSYMGLIILIVALVCCALMAVFFSHIYENSTEELALRLESLSGKIVSQLEQVVHIADQLSTDPVVQQSMSSSSGSDLPRYLQQQYLQQQFTPLIAKLLLISSSLEIFDPLNSRGIYRDAILLDRTFTDFLSSHAQVALSPPGFFPIELSGHTQQEALTIVCYQRLFDERAILTGYLLAVLDKSFLFSTVWEQMVGTDFTGVEVFDHQGTCIHAAGRGFTPEEIGLDLSEGQRKHSYRYTVARDQFQVFIQPVAGFNWTIAAVVPYSTLFHRLIMAMLLILGIGACAVALSFALSAVIAKRITHPLIEVTDAMHRYDREQKLEQIEVAATGELAYLVTVYNRMVRSINSSMQAVYEEQEKRHQAQLLSLQYEMDFLQAQINPHFIHNTLNAVGYQALKHGDDELYQSLKAFNTLLRASISGTREMICLNEELQLVSSFAQIQRLRYGQSFTITYAIDEKYLQFEVPKLILQPVVENAICYGETTDRLTEIIISAASDSGIFSICVTDNGPGMDRTYLSSRHIPDRRKFNRVGLINIDERLKMLFGSSFGIEIVSTRGEGTQIMISMPEDVG